MNKSVSIRSIWRELDRGQDFFSFCDDEVHAIFAWQRVMETARVNGFVMLFTVFTRLNSSWFRYGKKHTVSRARRRAEKLTWKLDQWPQWELNRRQRYQRKRERERTSADNRSCLSESTV